MGAYIRLDHGAIQRLVEDSSDAALESAATVTANRARINLSNKGRHSTGRLGQSIQARKAGPFQWTVGSFLEYAIYQEEGVRGPVYPRRAKVLRFKPKGASQFVFARFTKGFPGAHYLRDAYQSLTEADFRP